MGSEGEGGVERSGFPILSLRQASPATVGDGHLPHYGAQAIGASFWIWKPLKPLAVTMDYRPIGDPGYGRDRWRASLFALRLHGAF